MLKAIADALSSTNDQYYFFLDLQTGAVVKNTGTLDNMDIPYLLHAQPDRFLPLPRKQEIHAYGIMEQFLPTVTSQNVQRDLRNALDQPSPFRRFRDVIKRNGLEAQWEQFREQAFLEKARKWCADNRIVLPENPPPEEAAAPGGQNPGVMAVGLIESIRLLHRSLDPEAFERALDHLRKSFEQCI